MKEGEENKDLKSELLLSCGCRLDVHAKCYENARGTIKLRNGQRFTSIRVLVLEGNLRKSYKPVITIPKK